MHSQSWLYRAAGVAALGMLFLTGCAHKQPVAAKPPAPVPPPAPTATITASRSNIDPGSSVTLTWSTRNADQVTIAQLGSVAASGSRQVSPAASTTYALVAHGPGGEADASARVTVNAAAISDSESTLFARNVKDVFFDYDKYAVNPNEDSAVTSDARFLEQHPDIKLVLEGHCDERGSDEYNLALGQNRAQAVKEQLVRLGVSADRIKLTTFGKEHPFCTDQTEACFQQNRRAHFVMQ